MGRNWGTPSAFSGGRVRFHGRVQLGLEGAVAEEALAEAGEQQAAARLLAMQPEDLGTGGEQHGGPGVAAPVLAADDGVRAMSRHPSPAPRANLTRFHGVFAPGAQEASVVPEAAAREEAKKERKPRVDQATVLYT